MHSVSVSDEIRQNPNWRAAVDIGTALMEEELGNSAPGVKASWELVRHTDGTPLFQLTISDFYEGRAEDRFLLNELRNTNTVYLRNRLHRLWGEVLKDALDKQQAKVKQSVAQLEGD